MIHYMVISTKSVRIIDLESKLADRGPKISFATQMLKNLLTQVGDLGPMTLLVMKVIYLVKVKKVHLIKINIFCLIHFS